MTDFFEIHEIDDSDVQMRLFAQTLTREVKKILRGLSAGTITDLAVFHILF